MLSFPLSEKNCTAIPDPADGTITYNPVGDTTCGSTATASCDTGYILTASGDEVRYCGEDSNWNGTAKSCTSKNADIGFFSVSNYIHFYREISHVENDAGKLFLKNFDCISLL